ncbi:hypothetical protein AB0E10_18900 [Streptomyces sp. NPDC048045]|uniref:hypothetical protein n=1 Tax=Streptomyces sp. NPDC048045 TaxID=3154710 RepID=UPI003440FD9B
MTPTLRRLFGVTAAAAMGATALLGAGAGSAAADGDGHHAHCDRVERPIWIDDPSRNMTGHGCSAPDNGRRWYVVDIDTLVQPRYKTEYVNGGIDRTETLHNRTVRCMGYTTDKDTLNWFGCVPD